MNMLKVHELRILLALAKADTMRGGARHPGINHAELAHLIEKLETITGQAEVGVCELIGVTR